MSTPEFQDKFIAFVDILGFKEHVKAAERQQRDISLQRILSWCKGLQGDSQQSIAKYAAVFCPQSERISADLDFQVTQISDCVIVSAEISPAGVIHVIGHCWTAAMELLTQGPMIRGYITRGLVYHQGNQVIGTGYQSALEMESSNKISVFAESVTDRGTPFIEIDPVVSEFVAQHSDECVRSLYDTFVESDGTLQAVFPFKRLSPAAWLGGANFDPVKGKQSVETMRGWLLEFQERLKNLADPSNDRAAEKIRRYVALLDSQLQHCSEVAEMLDRFASSYPKGPTA